MLGVADHAAVSATVEAAGRWHEARRGGGLVNAVLRRAAREAEAFPAAPVTSVWPDWLTAKLKSALGAERAEAMAELQLEEPPIDLTLKPGEDAAAWAEKLGAECAAVAARCGWRAGQGLIEPAGLCRGRVVGAGRGGGPAGEADGRCVRASCGG